MFSEELHYITNQVPLFEQPNMVRQEKMQNTQMY